MARATNRDWIADEFGDLRPEVAEALNAEGTRREARRAASPPNVPPRGGSHPPGAQFPSWLPGAILSLIIVVGLALGGALAVRKVRGHGRAPVVKMESFVTSVAVPNAKLRAKPDIHSMIVLVLQPNQRVEVVGLWNGWVRVHVAGVDGWIYGGLLRSVGGNILGPATLIKPMVVKAYTGRIVLYLGQKLLIEGHSAPGYVVAVLPDGRRVSVPSAHLLFTAGT